MIAGAFLEKVLSSALLRIFLGVELEHTVSGALLGGIQSSVCAFFYAMVAGAFLEKVLSSALLRIELGVELEHTVIAALDHCLSDCLGLLKLYACLNWEIFKQVNL